MYNYVDIDTNDSTPRATLAGASTRRWRKLDADVIDDSDDTRSTGSPFLGGDSSERRSPEGGYGDDSRPAMGSTKNTSALNVFGTSIAFIIIVCAWGLLDTLVEMASGGVLWKEAVIYCCLSACGVLGLIIFSRLLPNRFSIEKAMNVF